MFQLLPDTPQSPCPLHRSAILFPAVSVHLLPSFPSFLLTALTTIFLEYLNKAGIQTSSQLMRGLHHTVDVQGKFLGCIGTVPWYEMLTPCFWSRVSSGSRAKKCCAKVTPGCQYFLFVRQFVDTRGPGSAFEEFVFIWSFLSSFQIQLKLQLLLL